MRWFERLAWLLTAIALAMTAYYLVALVVAEQIFSGVNGIFWTIGQSMLNGFTLYEDIFETKPPLVFILSAASLKIFGSPVLGYVLHTFLLFAVPAGAVVYAKRRLSEIGQKSLPLLLTALLFSTLVIRHLSRHPTAWAIEFFGLTAGCLFLIVFADAKRITVGRIALLALLLGMTVGMKESFLLPAFAGVLVLSRSPRQFLRGFVVPCILTGLIGVAALAAIGSLRAYFTIYLAEIFGYYTQRFYMPFLHKGMVFDKIFEHLNLFSTGFLLLTLALLITPRLLALSVSGRRTLWMWTMVVIAIVTASLYSATSFFFDSGQGALLLVIGLCLHRRFFRGIRSSSDIALVIAALTMLSIRYICVAIRFVGELFSGQQIETAVCISGPVIGSALFVMGLAVAWSVITVLRSPDNDERPLLLSQCALLITLFIFYGLILLNVQVPFTWTAIVFPAAVLCLAWKAWSTRATEEGDTLLFLGLRFAGLFVATYAVAMGSDFQGHHFLSFTPFVFALFLTLVDRLVILGNRTVTLSWMAVIALVVVLNPLRHPSLDNLRSALADSTAQMDAYQAQATAIDRILDACSIPRYLVLYAGDVHAFTRHSPQNFFLWAGLEGVAHHPEVSERTFISVADADIVFIGPDIPPADIIGEIDKGMLQYIQAKFSETPWPCAANLAVPNNMAALYRTERGGEAMPQL